MKRFLLFFPFICLLGCSDLPKEPSSANLTTKTFYDSSSIRYKKLIEGLRHDYVLYYRTIKNIGSDLTTWGMPETDSAFRIDSVKYWESYRDFFNQDGDFVNWLLGFKYDTADAGLWAAYHNPISSYISECNLPTLSNSRAAIILLENFLTGDGFECFECEYGNRQKCNLEKYVEIENFLYTNKNKNIIELRNAWRKKKER